MTTNDNVKFKMNNISLFLLLSAAVGAISTFIGSLLSLSKLGDAGDGNPIYTPLRVVNRDFLGLAIAVMSIVLYLWKRDRGK